jgi:hypothetical protein
LQMKTLRDKEHHNYEETPKILNFYSSMYPLVKRQLQLFILKKKEARKP